MTVRKIEKRRQKTVNAVGSLLAYFFKFEIISSIPIYKELRPKWMVKYDICHILCYNNNSRSSLL